MKTDYDIVVIGSGPGGYVAAIRAAQLGLKAAIIERYDILGGTCTVVGCIPTKALLDASEHYHDVQHKVGKMGINVEGISLDFSRFIERKAGVVKSNSDGVNYLMRKNKVKTHFGTGSFINCNQIQVTAKDGSVQLITADYFIIATGSKPTTIHGVEIDKRRIITSTEALSLKEQPKSIVIIGGGVIGVELASVYARIGTKVTIIEYADVLIPVMDRELGRELKKILNKLNIDSRLNCRVQSAVNKGDRAEVTYIDSSGNLQAIGADYCLVAVGRKPYTAGLGLENTRINVDERGRIKTDGRLRTAEINIFAIGDVVAGPMLAHKAEEEATFVVESILGLNPHLNYHTIPSVVYTWPEVASVGYTEEELKEKNIAYRKGKFPFLASGRARAADDTDGFVKVLADTKEGEILGVHIIGARSADLIQQAVVAMEFEIGDAEMGKICYAHPTYSEVLKDAFLESCGCGAINI
ncbi:dihydrolipoyl dehydrogenase [Mucilaginibacter sabulilitoris]|uniref:Dihydrolipoyl dehydrogenase n=1 Tax=Mucilaginibacter sabulilitoris TaxID=1173583 RepID=A0ABZ0TVP6_9SPHI|nr:dihydrolipoyl dehydrogenase [Mucilaginibacter sabulilitoris]WPU96942.1 dihydrolipoyl dehydrogenase [Mucilaginibacter sabulilitoris]